MASWMRPNEPKTEAITQFVFDEFPTTKPEILFGKMSLNFARKPNKINLSLFCPTRTFIDKPIQCGHTRPFSIIWHNKTHTHTKIECSSIKLDVVPLSYMVCCLFSVNGLNWTAWQAQNMPNKQHNVGCDRAWIGQCYFSLRFLHRNMIIIWFILWEARTTESTVELCGGHQTPNKSLGKLFSEFIIMLSGMGHSQPQSEFEEMSTVSKANPQTPKRSIINDDDCSSHGVAFKSARILFSVS